VSEGVCPRGDLPTNPTHRFELLAGTLRLPEHVFSVVVLVRTGDCWNVFGAAASLTAVRTLGGSKRFRRERWGKRTG
jgi:hypothetical protein